MLKGSSISLRPVRESDVERLYEHHLDLDNRGGFFPRGIVSRAAVFRRAHETGLWGPDDGTLVIEALDGELVGHIEFFRTVAYLDEYELSYIVYATAQRGRGSAASDRRRVRGAPSFPRMSSRSVSAMRAPPSATASMRPEFILRPGVLAQWRVPTLVALAEHDPIGDPAAARVVRRVDRRPIARYGRGMVSRW